MGKAIIILICLIVGGGLFILFYNRSCKAKRDDYERRNDGWRKRNVGHSVTFPTEVPDLQGKSVVGLRKDPKQAGSPKHATRGADGKFVSGKQRTGNK